MSKSNFLVLLLFITYGIAVFIAIKGDEARHQLKTHIEYYNKTEELLDSICVSDSAFIGITETQVYSDYLEIRDKIRVE